jgi:hypothetical protein
MQDRDELFVVCRGGTDVTVRRDRGSYAGLAATKLGDDCHLKSSISQRSKMRGCNTFGSHLIFSHVSKCLLSFQRNKKKTCLDEWFATLFLEVVRNF